MSNTAASGVTTPLAEWVAGLKIADIPASVRLRAKHLLLDSVACGLTGANSLVLPVLRQSSRPPKSVGVTLT